MGPFILSKTSSSKPLLDSGVIESCKLQTGTHSFPGTGVGTGPNFLHVGQLHSMASGVEGAIFVASALGEGPGIDVLSLLDELADVMFCESSCCSTSLLFFSHSQGADFLWSCDRMCQLMHKIFRFTQGDS